MGSLAGLLHARGVAVSGSDEKLYPPMSTQLERWGIPVREGFRAEHVAEAQPDLVPYRGQCMVHRSQLQQAAGDWPDAIATVIVLDTD